MPRKTASRAPRRPTGSRFNEAAARCRGKLDFIRAGRGRRGGFNEAAARCRGKQGRSHHADARAQASMRPRPDAAENNRKAVLHGVDQQASMRPRPDAAENGAEGSLRLGNEGASMRPRPDAAENAPSRPRCPEDGHRFNEAAARCRGKRRRPAPDPSAATSFNEAAARCRGKLGRIVVDGAAAYELQ